MKKTILLLSTLTLLVHANSFNTQEFMDLNKPADVSEFKYLQPTNKDKKATQDLLSDMINSAGNGDKFLNKGEIQNLKKEVEDLSQIAIAPKDFLIMFISASVPKNYIANVIRDVTILQENGVPLLTKQYVMGPPANFKQYMMDWEKFLKGQHGRLSNYVIPNFGLKIDPKLFHAYYITKVPALAYAKCAGDLPDVATCQISHVIHGDVSLTTFFEHIVREDKVSDTKYFQEYIKILNANQIYDSKMFEKTKDN